MATVKGKIPVRGTCKHGHVTEGVSDKGRVTAELICGHDGCTEKVKGRRIPADPAGGKPDTVKPTKPSASAGDGVQYRVREVIYDRDDPEPGPHAGHASDSPDDPGGSPGVDHAGSGGGAPADPPARVETPRPQPRDTGGRWKRRRRRLTRDERRAARAAIDQDWIVPGVLPR